jgi:hypothetical protein
MPSWSWRGAGQGGATGAAAGSMVSPGWGTAIGAVGGALVGGFSGGAQDDANNQRNAAVNQAMADQERIRRDSAAQREVDLQRTMAFYGPALQQLEHLYGIPMSAWGQGLPQNQQRGQVKTGMINGMPVSQAPMRPQFAGQMSNLGGTIKPIQGLQSAQMRPAFQPMGMNSRMAPRPPAAAPPPPPVNPFGPGRRY